MSTGPLRRLTGGLGLLALVPTAWLLATGAIGLEVAAIRSVVTLLLLVGLGRVAGAVIGALAGRIEREHDPVDEVPAAS